jgi:hypothetical protein
VTKVLARHYLPLQSVLNFLNSFKPTTMTVAASYCDGIPNFSRSSRPERVYIYIPNVQSTHMVEDSAGPPRDRRSEPGRGEANLKEANAPAWSGVPTDVRERTNSDAERDTSKLVHRPPMCSPNQATMDDVQIRGQKSARSRM